jgi:4,5-dihydroxyphthalate decarboxylase
MAKKKKAGKRAAAKKAGAKKAAKRGTMAKRKARSQPLRQSTRSKKAAKTPARRASGKLRLTMMTGDYEIVRALKDGTVAPKGIELVTGFYPGTRSIHDKVAHGKACDINEYNGGHYVVQKAHGREDITAIPVFLHRRFRHGFIYVNTGKGITKPADLAGRRVGSRTIGAAANYWMRGHLEEHGAPHRSINWVIQDTDEASEQAPPSTRIEVVPKGKKIEEMVLTGEVDAIIMPNVNEAHAKGDPRIARLWPNYKAVETDYYNRTGFFPIMHVTTVPTEIVAKYPWVVESLTLAFEEAKQLAFKRLANPRNVPLAFWRTYQEEERALLGPDPWEYGLSDLNQRNYGTLVNFVHDQVLQGPRPSLRDLFAKEAFELSLPLPRMHGIEYHF